MAVANPRNDLQRNILANYLGAGTVALAPILALPWYLAALGPQQFGLIGFIVMLQAILGLLDAGMSQALVREVAVRLDATAGGQQRTASLLFGFERLYWLFGFGAGGLTLLAADFVAAHWLNLGGLPAVAGQQAVYGAAFIFAAQFPGSLYRSVLIGAQAQVALNASMLGGALVRHAGGVLVVLFWPSLSTYLIWHASIGLLETLVRGWLAWRTLNVKRHKVKWERQEIRSVWRLLVGMSGAAWLGALTVQMDKIVLSRMTSIEQFGYYSIAAMVAVGVLQLIYPLVQAVLPRAIQLREEPGKLRSLSLKLTGLIALMVVMGVVIFATAGKWLLNLWLRSPQAVEVIYPLLSVLLIGTSLNAFYNVGYVHWLVNGKIRRVLQVNASALVLSVAIIPPLVGSQGPMGAAFGWLVINLIGFVLSLEWLKKKQGERNF